MVAYGEDAVVKRFLRWGSILLVVAFVLVQVVPYGRAHDNPAVTGEPAWPSPRARELAKRACFDCHSHETVWPWYSHVAPMSWLVQKDVVDGRKHLNFSTWDRSQENADEAAGEVAQGEMPPALYLPLHPEARLTDAEKDELLAALRAIAPPSGGGKGGHEEREKDEPGRR